MLLKFKAPRGRRYVYPWSHAVSSASLGQVERHHLGGLSRQLRCLLPRLGQRSQQRELQGGAGARQGANGRWIRFFGGIMPLEKSIWKEHAMLLLGCWRCFSWLSRNYLLPEFWGCDFTTEKHVYVSMVNCPVYHHQQLVQATGEELPNPSCFRIDSWRCAHYKSFLADSMLVSFGDKAFVCKILHLIYILKVTLTIWWSGRRQTYIFWTNTAYKGKPKAPSTWWT